MLRWLEEVRYAALVQIRTGTSSGFALRMRSRTAPEDPGSKGSLKVRSA